MKADRIAELKQLVPNDLVSRVAAAAEADPAFRAAFLADPKGAYRSRFGQELLPGQNIVVDLRADGSTYVYLPQLEAGFVVGPATPAVDAALSDEELELSVGGSTPVAKGGKSTAFFRSLVGDDAGVQSQKNSD